MKSEVAPFLILLLFTAPATWMAPPKSSSFSVRVVLPASGWAITAKVRRREISSCNVMFFGRKGRRHGDLFPELVYLYFVGG